MNETASFATIASVYGRDVYANKLDLILLNTMPWEGTIFRVLGKFMRGEALIRIMTITCSTFIFRFS